MQEPRSTGIQSVGPAPFGTHICAFHDSQPEMMELTRSFICAGLHSGEACLWVLGAGVDRTTALSVLDLDDNDPSDRLFVVPYQEVFLRQNRLDPDQATARYMEVLRTALARGHQGLRICFDMDWVPKVDRQRLADFEASVGHSTSQLPVLTLCVYPTATFDVAESLCISSRHGLTLIRSDERWQLSCDRRVPTEVVPKLGGGDPTAALMSMADAVMATDQQGRITAINAAAERLTAWTANDAIGRPLDEVVRLLDGATGNAMASAALQLLRGNPPDDRRNGVSVVARSGVRHSVLERVAPIRDAAGTLKGVVVVLYEVAEQRSAERAKERQHRAILALGRCSDALAQITDEPSLLQSVCQILVDPCGYSMAWVLMRRQDDSTALHHAAWAEAQNGLFARLVIGREDEKRGPDLAALAVRTGGDVIIRSLLPDDSLPPHNGNRRRGYGSSIAMALSVDGHVIGALVVCAPEPDAFDELEAQLVHRIADGLSCGIESLRARSERERMRAQLLFADRLVSVGTLAAGVAHEINNPLAYVLGNIELADRSLALALAPALAPGLAPTLGPACNSQAQELTERLRARLAQIREGVERVRVIARDLKVFTHVDSDTNPTSNLERVLDAAINIAWNDMRHRARLIRELSGSLYVCGSEARLGQVFLNLITNAVQAIPEGDAEHNQIRVAARTRGDAVEVEVSDTGVGIAPEHRRRLFDQFFTTKPVGEGTGLGLSISKSIVAELGGAIDFESTPGRGTTFRVRLPAADRGEVTPAPATTPQPTGAGGVPRRRILVIDDEQLLADVVCEALSHHDARAETDPVRALEQLQRGDRFDLILCDLMMPTMNGADLYARIAEVDAEQASRIVFMTGGAFTVRSKEFLDRIDNELIEKPFEINDLLSVVARRLRR